VDSVERLKSFNAKPSGTRVLDLSYMFMFNKRNQQSEHLLKSYNISGCQCAHQESVCGMLIIAPIIFKFGSMPRKCSASCSGRFISG